MVIFSGSIVGFLYLKYLLSSLAHILQFVNFIGKGMEKFNSSSLRFWSLLNSQQHEPPAGWPPRIAGCMLVGGNSISGAEVDPQQAGVSLYARTDFRNTMTWGPAHHPRCSTPPDVWLIASWTFNVEASFSKMFCIQKVQISWLYLQPSMKILLFLITVDHHTVWSLFLAIPCLSQEQLVTGVTLSFFFLGILVSFIVP